MMHFFLRFQINSYIRLFVLKIIEISNSTIFKLNVIYNEHAYEFLKWISKFPANLHKIKVGFSSLSLS